MQNSNVTQFLKQTCTQNDFNLNHPAATETATTIIITTTKTEKKDKYQVTNNITKTKHNKSQVGCASINVTSFYLQQTLYNRTHIEPNIYSIHAHTPCMYLCMYVYINILTYRAYNH